VVFKILPTLMKQSTVTACCLDLSHAVLVVSLQADHNIESKWQLQRQRQSISKWHT
jgi:hypothetical protein